MEEPKFVVCLNNEGYAASLEIGKLYQVIPDEEAERLGGLRVVDEDGEDYFYDAEKFCPIQVPPIVAHTLASISKQG